MYHKVIARHIVNHVVPTEHNGFIPHLLKERAMWAILGVGVGLFGFSHLLHTTGYLNIAAEVYPNTIVSLTNEDRVANNLQPVSVSPTLVAAAKLKAADMVANSYFAHTSPAGITPWHWFEQAKYSFVYAGENLAIDFNESGDVERAWLNSPTHRANVLSPNFTEMGVATAEGIYQGRETTFVVELFGSPAIVKAPIVEPTTTPTAPAKPVAVKTPEPTTAKVAGESTHTPKLAVVKETPTFVAVQNTDPNIIETPVVQNSTTTQIPWYDRILLNSDKYIAVIIQIIIVALILALTGLGMREYQKHHFKHMAYGMLMTVILTSFLFVGRIGVFAETAPSLDATSLQE